MATDAMIKYIVEHKLFEMFIVNTIDSSAKSCPQFSLGVLFLKLQVDESEEESPTTKKGKPKNNPHSNEMAGNKTITKPSRKSKILQFKRKQFWLQKHNQSLDRS